MTKRKFRLFLLGAAAVMSVIILLGGLTLMVYIGLLLSGLFIGWKGKGLYQLYTDYKLALRINTVQFSYKRQEEMQLKIDRYEKEIATAADRLKLYQASAASQKPFVPPITPTRHSVVHEDSI